MKKQTVLLVFTLLWMAVIFGFSAKPAEESADMSLSVGRWIGQAFVPAYDGWDEGKQETFAEKIDHPVRKCAHASEYAVLGMLLAPLFLTWGTDKNQNPAQGTHSPPWQR